MSVKQAPQSPDYQGAAQQTGDASKSNVNQQTAANRPNQTNALGSQSQWSQDASGNWTQSSSLAPGLQSGANNLEGQIANQGPLGNGEDARNQAITGAYNQATSRLDPRFAQADEQLSSKLANQGLDPNSQAYRNAMLQQSQSKNDAYGSAMNSAIGQGTAAQQATFNENLQAQNAPYQQLQGLLGLGGQSGFNAAGQAQAPNYLGAALGQGQYNMDAWQASNQANADLWGGIGGLAKSFVPFGQM